MTAPAPGLWKCVALVASAALFGAAEAAESPRPVIEPSDGGRSVRVTVMLPEAAASQLPQGGVDEQQGQAWLAFVMEEKGEEGPPIFGDYRRDGRKLTFTPRFSLAAGKTYRAVLSSPRGRVSHTDYNVPHIDAPTTLPGVPGVAAVYPSAERVPANLLKFYIHFDRPMRRTEHIFDQVHIIDESAEGGEREVREPWRRLALWSDDDRRLTMWIHPGRVKQGVNLREQEGPVLRPGRKYRLVIDADVLDGDGQPLGTPLVHRVIAIGEDYDRPNLMRWTLHPPAAGTQQPLTLSFTEPMDHSLLGRMVHVLSASGERVTGRIEIGPGERTWLFHPADTWQAGEYAIEIDETMEDLAGNTPLRVFDTDLASGDPRPLPTRRTFKPTP